MSAHPFEERAERAAAEGEFGRAVLTLAEGLKRHPDAEQASVRMTELYLEHAETPGLEESLVEALAVATGGEACLARIRRRLRSDGPARLVRHFEAALRDRGLDPTARSGRSTGGGDGGEAGDRGGESAEGEPDETGEASEGGSADRVARDRSDGEGAAQSGVPRDRDGAWAGDETAVSSPEGASGGEPEESEPGRQEAPTPSEPSDGRGSGEDGGSVASAGRAWAGRRRVRLSLLGLGLVGLGLAAAWWWLWPLYLGSRADAAVAGWRPGRTAEVVDELDALSSRAPGDFDARAAFVDSMGRLAGEESSGTALEGGGRWRRAAAANYALARGDLERALREKIRFDRRSTASLPGRWVIARVSEARGRLDRAASVYRRASRDHPEFVSFAAGRLRVGLERMDRRAARRAARSLEELAPDHPIRALADVPFPWESRRADRADPSGGEFESSVAAYLRARRAARSGAAERALEHLRSASGPERSFGPAIWTAGELLAGGFEVRSAAESFRRAASIPGLPERVALRLCAGAPRALRGAGRPDLAAEFLRIDRPVSLQTRSMTGEWSLPETVTPSIDCGSVDEPPSAVDAAAVERIRTLAALGHRRRAANAAGDVDGAGRAVRVLRAGLEVAGRQPSRLLAGEPSGWSERLVAAHYRGDSEAVRSLGGRVDGLGGAGSEALRYGIRAELRLGRRDAARALLAGSELAPTSPVRARLRALIAARARGKRRPPIPAALTEVETTSIEFAADVAEMHIWRGELDRAVAILGGALARQTDHPRSNWLRGWVARIRGEEDAEKYLERSVRFHTEDAAVGLWTARYHLQRGRPARARRDFYRALVARPFNLAAVRGFGRACIRSGAVGRARRVLGRLIARRAADASSIDDPVAVEALRWLAVAEGSRRGVEGAGEPLSRAADSPAIWLERARWSRANEDFERARSQLDRSLEGDPALAAAHLEAAQMAEASGDRASSHLERYLAIAPHGPRAQWARRQLDSSAESASSLDEE